MAISEKQKTVCQDHFRAMAYTLYAMGDGRDGSEPWKLQQTHMGGFIQAVELLEVMSREEVQQIIDEVHLEVFGEARLDRRERIDGIDAKVERGDWESFDAPAWTRR